VAEWENEGHRALLLITVYTKSGPDWSISAFFNIPGIEEYLLPKEAQSFEAMSDLRI
jgi:hypothetical protein